MIYGNSLVNRREEIGVDKATVFTQATEFYPGGTTIECGDAYPAGTAIPAGTAVGLDKIGGELTLNADAPIGHTYRDGVVEENGCLTVGVVTKGQINGTVCEANLTNVAPGVSVINL